MLRLLLLICCCNWLLHTLVNGTPLPLPMPMPIEIIYTGEGCPCPQPLGFEVNAPIVSLPKKYVGGKHSYRIEKPALPPKPKVLYKFDFAVEKPPPPPMKPKARKYKLFAKVDRIVMNKQDCPSNAASPEPSCGCTQMRYVNQPCMCKQEECKRNQAYIVPNTIYQQFTASANQNMISRSKRELHNSLFRKRFLRDSNKRPQRYVKFYHKDLDTYKKLNSLNLDMPLGILLPATKKQEMRTKLKRKSKKLTLNTDSENLGPFTRWVRSHRISKRDIKAEYDLMEKERNQMDLTLPEIIQYMPETLQPNFKRKKCHFGCAEATSQTRSTSNANTNADVNANANVNVNVNAAPEGDSNMNVNEVNYNGEHMSVACAQQEFTNPIYKNNTITAKRNVGNYDSFGIDSFYNDYQQTPPIQMVYGHQNVNYRYLPSDGQLRNLLSTTVVPDPLKSDSLPLQFTGDLYGIGTYGVTIEPLLGNSFLAQNNQYPVEHISNAQLDSIIASIVYRHPDFIDATSHFGGELVEPEPLQKQQTKDFLKKLIDGHLNLWPKEEMPILSAPTPKSAPTRAFAPLLGSVQYNYAYPFSSAPLNSYNSRE